jgi:hypothetical protein
MLERHGEPWLGRAGQAIAELPDPTNFNAGRYGEGCAMRLVATSVRAKQPPSSRYERPQSVMCRQRSLRPPTYGNSTTVDVA